MHRLGQVMVAWLFIAGSVTGLLLYRTADILAGSVRTDATVERFAEDGNRAAPVLRFRGLDGQEVEAVYRGSAGADEWQIGQRVGVLFDQENPRIVMPDEPTVLFRLPALAAVATLLPLVFFWPIRILARRRG